MSPKPTRSALPSGKTPASSDAGDAVATLASVRDWLRYAVSAFNAADLVYGHGTQTALDEAAFLILAGLKLPIDTIEPWLDARLTMAERRRMHALIATRIATRKPAPYLLGEAWIQGFRFTIDERVIVPRSYLGELMLRDAGLLVPEPEAVTRVLDLCTGSGCLAIIAAHVFPQAQIDAVDISADALEVARRNVADYDLAERVSVVPSDLFAALDGRRYDLILSNPPYVTTAAVDAFPPEHRHEPRIAHEAGTDGLDLVRRIVSEARRHLADDGTLVVEIGQARTALESLYPELAFVWLDTDESEGEVFLIGADGLPAGEGRRGARRDGPGRRRRLARI